MSFGCKWGTWIKKCVSSTSFFYPLKEVYGKDDPLSHFPLVIIGEALSSMVVTAVEANLIRGFRLGS